MAATPPCTKRMKTRVVRSGVKGVDMVITNDVWNVVTGLKFSGVRINRGNLWIVE